MDQLPLLSITPEQAGSIQQTEQFALCNYQYTGTGKGHWFLSGQVKYQGDLTPWLNWLDVGRMVDRMGLGDMTLKSTIHKMKCKQAFISVL